MRTTSSEKTALAYRYVSPSFYYENKQYLRLLKIREHKMRGKKLDQYLLIYKLLSTTTTFYKLQFFNNYTAKAVHLHNIT